MIPRRISTVLAWIRTLGVIEQVGENYRISGAIIPILPLITLNDIDKPVIPSTGNLQQYETVEQRVSNAHEIITIYKNQALLERANNAHRELVNLIADRIRIAGGIPKSNQFIDLAAILEHDCIFEMKSTNETNVKSQIRKGISQLYEYRYLQNKPSANLVLVIEKPVIGDNSWMVDYIENDRNIQLVWDGNDQLYGTIEGGNKLGFLNLLT